MNDVWVEVCTDQDIAIEDVMRFDHNNRTFAIYHTSDGKYYATDGLCTHAKVHLSGGFVMDNTIECPKHNGRFEIPTGKAKGAPACIDLKTFPVKCEAGKIFLNLA